MEDRDKMQLEVVMIQGEPDVEIKKEPVEVTEEPVKVKEESVDSEDTNNVGDEKWLLRSSLLEPIVKIESVEDEYQSPNPESLYQYHSSYVQEQYNTDLNNISLKIEPEVIIREEEGNEFLISDVPNNFVETEKDKTNINTGEPISSVGNSCKLVPVIIDGREIRFATIGGSSSTTASTTSSNSKPTQTNQVEPQRTENDCDSPQPIFCHECFQMFLNAEDLRNHMPEHENDRPFKCNDCGKRFCFNKDLTRHLNRGHKYLPIKIPVHTEQPVKNPTQTFVCKICDLYFKNSTALKSHFSEHTKPKPYVCYLCGDANSSLDSLSKHVQNVHSKYVYFSESNPYRHPKNMTFQSVSVVDKPTSHVVLQKGNISSTVNSEIVEKRKESSPEIIQNKKIRKILPKSDEEIRRAFIRDNIKIIEICEKKIVPVIIDGKEIKLTSIGENNSTTTSSSILESRLRSAQKSQEPSNPVYCTECFGAFSNAEELQKHLPFHENDRPFKCETCDKKFLTKKNLRKHMERGHKNLPIRIKPAPASPSDPSFICQICKKCFRSSYHLRNHFSEHTKVNPFVCQICGDSFSTLNFLNQHMLQIHDIFRSGQHHTKIKNAQAHPIKKEKPKMKNKNDEYECEACVKTFKDIESLEQHEKIHEVIKPRACPLCGLTMFSKYTLKGHLTNVHKQRVMRSKQPRFSSLHLA